jgi:SAM-dependent methyltransferase
MPGNSDRARGVTPTLSRDYAARTADQQAAFLLPYLRPGMSLLDAGCGPGSITMGLAGRVAPGAVMGIDHDPVHIDAASARVVQRRQTNATFRVGDILALPFDAATFDVAFENDVLLHLPERARSCACSGQAASSPRVMPLPTRLSGVTIPTRSASSTACSASGTTTAAPTSRSAGTP